ncbi:MAG: hypothetical protein JJU22_02450 [Gammaproteobacteria bacterium]|nr:hypothetical protein [Gammaproteobacteria bacterium]
MDRSDWRRLRVELLRAGVAPRRVSRMLRELADHHADLRDAALRAGHSPWEADLLARCELGDEEAILAAVLERQELRSPASRWPWVVYGLAPAALLAGCVLAVLLLTGLAVGSGVELPAMARTWIGTLFGVANYGLPVLIAMVVLLTAALRHAPIAWPVFGTLLVIAIGSALTIDIRWPNAAGDDGLLLMTYRYGPDELGYASAMLLGLLGPYLALRGRMA